MGYRQLQKEKTRQAFMQAALDMVGDGRSFTSISLRELAARVGVVPTAVYRHFDDLDGLGTAIVAAVLPELRSELKALRQQITDLSQIMESSVTLYFDYVLAHRKEFLFCGREITGGSKVIRTSLRLEIAAFTGELADDIRKIPDFRALSDQEVHAMADLIVRAILTIAQDLVGISDHPEVIETLKQRTILQMKMIALGARGWGARTSEGGANLP